MSILQELANQLLKKPLIEDNIQTINGKRLSDILPPINPPDKPNWVQNPAPTAQLPPINPAPQNEGQSPAWLQSLAASAQNPPKAELPPIVAPVQQPVDNPPKLLPQIAPINNPVSNGWRPPLVEDNSPPTLNDAIPPTYTRGNAVNSGGVLPPINPDPVDSIAPDKLSQLTLAEHAYNDEQKRKVVNEDHGKKGWLKELAINALAGAGEASRNNPQGGWGNILGGAIGGGAAGAIDRTQNEQRAHQNRLRQLGQNYQTQKQFEDDKLAQKMKQTQIDNTNFDNDTQRQYNQDRIKNQQNELQRKRDKDKSDAEAKAQARVDKQAQIVAGMFNRVTSFDPGDPKNAAVVKQMQEIGLPVFKKDGTKDIKYFQDEDTGAWFTTIADKATGKSETHAVLKNNGNPLVTTPRIKVQGENAVNVANINQSGAKERTEITQAGATGRTKITQAGANKRLQTTLQNRNDQQKQKLAGDTLTRWQQNYVKANGAMPTEAQVNAARQSINSSIFGNQE